MNNQPDFQAAFNFDHHSVAISTLLESTPTAHPYPYRARQKSSTHEAHSLQPTRPKVEYCCSKGIVDGACRGGGPRSEGRAWCHWIEIRLLRRSLLAPFLTRTSPSPGSIMSSTVVLIVLGPDFRADVGYSGQPFSFSFSHFCIWCGSAPMCHCSITTQASLPPIWLRPSAKGAF